ncbi:anti-sigma factor family protein [Lignipirellula cremea]|uniref:Zinc-finger domain-containing protein n=1 Tax=Lignipirellula cremea TaxID=2528010 RepID=A0A518DXD4_9BACT|nr:zf-HC2 domain-containing protein [Lignipirellula cremea]QDU96501.1 hypothetical protein Pla8534_43220 [Lignipirellula cremea]
MLSCKEISKLVSLSLDRKLSLGQRMSLWLHLGMCRLCWRFRRSLMHLHNETREQANALDQHAVDARVRMPDDCRARLKKIIDSHTS